MLLVVGTYRADMKMIERALTSLDKHLTGMSRLVFVDDSGDEKFRTRLAKWGVGEVVETGPGNMGYNVAMRKVCEVAGEHAFMFWEEDFTLLEDIDMQDLLGVLWRFPHLAQIALLRGAHFPIEHEKGGVIEGLQARLPGSVTNWLEVGGEIVIEQKGTFTCNPSMWAAGIASLGWPAGQWSEDRKRDDLIARGYRFGFLPGVKVEHDGERRGHGY